MLLCTLPLKCYLCSDAIRRLLDLCVIFNQETEPLTYTTVGFGVALEQKEVDFNVILLEGVELHYPGVEKRQLRHK